MFPSSSALCLILSFPFSKAAPVFFEDHFSSERLPRTHDFNSVMRFFFTKAESKQVTVTTI
jgi:hypothetical protein